LFQVDFCSLGPDPILAEAKLFTLFHIFFETERVIQMKRIVDELAKIPWNTLDVASGKGGHVPQAFLGLISPDETVRNESYWQLDNEVVCQSDLYGAAYYVVPFLLDMLRERVPHGRDRIYDLLYEIANGDAPQTVRIRTHDGDEIPLKNACAREINKGVDIFRRDVADPDPRISAKSKELLDLLQNPG
jgi:hypothetical protein